MLEFSHSVLAAPRIKICCISSPEEAEMALRHGAYALGLVSAMPSGPGVIDESLIAEIARQVNGRAETFLLTAQQDADAIIDQYQRCCPSTLQLVDKVALQELRKLRLALPGVMLVQVIHVAGVDAIEESKEVAPFVDAILIDSGNQKLAVKELGGTGRTHDWAISRAIREQCGVPMFLAGGLKPENVRDAIDQVQPFCLDICSGVRSDGKLDEIKLHAFFRGAGK